MSKYNGYIIFFLYVLISLFPLHAQWENIRFRRLTIEHGLSQNSIQCLAQDDNGFIWIGTQAGVHKYDGYTFAIYKADMFDSTCLSNDATQCMYKDHNGVLWVGTDYGLNRYNSPNNTFTQYLPDVNNPNSMSDDRVFSICEDTNNELWIGTANGLNRLNRERNSFIRYFKDPDNTNSLSGNDIRAVYSDKAGVLWIGTNGNGLNRFDLSTKQFKHFTYDRDRPNSLSDNDILAIFEDRNGVLWIGTEKGGLNRFDKEKEQFTCYKTDPNDPSSLNDNRVESIYEDRSGRLWIGTNVGGVSVFDRESENFFSFQHDPGNPTSLGGSQIQSILEDYTGDIWIGTKGSGVSIYNKETEKFTLYNHNPQNNNSLSINSVWEIFEDRFGVLWIGTDYGGLNKFDRDKNAFTHYKHDKKNPHSISSDMVPRVYEDRSGVLWTGTDEGLDKFDRRTERFTHYTFDPDNPHSISHNKIRSIYEDRSGTFWIGTRGGGLNRFDRKTGHFTRYKHNPDDSTSISNDLVYWLYEDRFRNFWIGTFGGGLNKLDRETERFTRYLPDPGNIRGINNNFVSAIYEDRSGNFWVGTLGGGLNKFDRKSGIFTHYTEENGLSNNEVYAILEDDKGNLWMSSNNGISKFDPKTGTFKVYRVEDGLQSNEFNLFAACKSHSGEMFFGGINGFNAFFPDSIKDNPIPPSVLITGFRLANKPVPVGRKDDGRTILEKSITETGEVMLSYKDRVISFEFAALHYVAPEKNQYAYIMEGLEKEWNYVGSNRRFVTYSGLPPGKYVFKVKGSNSDGVWNEKGTSLKIRILPPFWKTMWFYILCIVSAVLLIAAIITTLVERMEEKKKEEERLRVITDVGQVLEHGMATIYRRKADSDVYDYIGNGIKDITGYDPEEFTLPVWNKNVISTELIGEHSELTLRQAVERMHERKIDSFVTDFNIHTKSGDVRWARDITTALRDESGNCYAYLGIIFDITDRKLAERELAQKRKSIQRTLFEHTPDPIIIFDKKTHTFLDCNKAFQAVYGYSKGEILTMTPFDLHPSEEISRVEKNIDVRNIDAPNEYKHITKDGRVLDVEILSDETVYEGKPAWISMVRNITEHKHTEQRLTQLTGELKTKNEEMEADLMLARDVQMALLSHNYPKNFPPNVSPEQSTLQFAHRYIPTSTLAGDFFEILPISDQQVGLMIYDVMGHGVRASLLTAYLHGLIEELMPIAVDPVAFLNRLNMGINAVTKQFYAGMFATAFYCVVDLKANIMHYANAGHPTPYVIQRDEGKVRQIADSGKKPDPALGLFTTHNFAAYEYPITKGDTVFFFTDGLYEVENKRRNIFGKDRLLKAVKNQLSKTPELMLDGILSEVKKYAGTGEFTDDVCMVTMHVR